MESCAFAYNEKCVRFAAWRERLSNPTTPQSDNADKGSSDYVEKVSSNHLRQMRGYLDTEAIFIDGTHIKASANLKKHV